MLEPKCLENGKQGESPRQTRVKFEDVVSGDLAPYQVRSTRPIKLAGFIPHEERIYYLFILFCFLHPFIQDVSIQDFLRYKEYYYLELYVVSSL